MAICETLTDTPTLRLKYISGIVSIINQLLVPSIEEKRSVKAELYKLNVYSGPSGNFKAYIDTPRGDSQVGSLVVALPSASEGEYFRALHV